MISAEEAKLASMERLKVFISDELSKKLNEVDIQIKESCERGYTSVIIETDHRLAESVKAELLKLGFTVSFGNWPTPSTLLISW